MNTPREPQGTLGIKHIIHYVIELAAANRRRRRQIWIGSEWRSCEPLGFPPRKLFFTEWLAPLGRSCRASSRTSFSPPPGGSLGTKRGVRIISSSQSDRLHKPVNINISIFTIITQTCITDVLNYANMVNPETHQTVCEIVYNANFWMNYLPPQIWINYLEYYLQWHSQLTA